MPPLGNGTLENLAVENGDPLTTRGHAMVGADSCCAALFLTTCKRLVNCKQFTL